MRILVTGMAAGLDDERFLKSVVRESLQDGVPIHYYDLMDRLQSSGDKEMHLLLGATDYLFKTIREREYGRIGVEIFETDEVNSIIRVPATIEWDYINVKLKDHEEIKRLINPDMVVTLIDAEHVIKDRIDSYDGENIFLRNIRDQGMESHEILSWMHEEVSLSEDWAEYFGVKHYVIPTAQHPQSFYKLLKHGDVPSFYVSYSMTHATEEAREEINDTILNLSDYGLVIDPQAIEIDQKMSAEDKDATFSYTVHRDLHWFVAKVDAVVAIHPYAERPPLSTGMMDELGHARDYLKKRYMIFPPQNLSPFTTNSYISRDCVFSNSHEFFLSIEADGIKKLEDNSRKDREYHLERG
jgi:hypothetical protein